MTIIVTLNQFRQNMATYLAKAKDGYEIILEDGKRGQRLAQLKAKKQFSPEAFEKALNHVAGIITKENHPEWETKEKVIKWVKKGRKAADRTF